MVRAILDDALVAESFRTDPLFGFEVPTGCPGVELDLLDPRERWTDRGAYDREYAALAERFRQNFDQFRGVAAPAVEAAGP